MLKAIVQTEQTVTGYKNVIVIGCCGCQCLAFLDTHFRDLDTSACISLLNFVL